ncbi:MAG TPA: NUDIX domain-containing protein [Pseudonocardia sp.]|nr:NUDIX domain-containing protein [Pseudonocardia sp.]
MIAAVRDDEGRLLMIRSTDSDRWTLPGGPMHVGESVADAAVRTIQDQSGLRIEIIGLVGLYTDVGHVTAYDTGEVRQEFSVCFHARPLGGELRRNSGTDAGEAGWVTIEDLESLSLHPTTQIRVNDALAERSRPRIA